ncbi:MAG: hypothetical protein U0793_11155 [Gemmataceae bacterium]
MRKPAKPPPAPEPPDVAKLAEVVEGLTHQVRQLALILDEVREELIWAVRNDRFHAAGHSQGFVESHTSAPADDDQDEEPEQMPVQPPPIRETRPKAEKKQPTLFS